MVLSLGFGRRNEKNLCKVLSTVPGVYPAGPQKLGAGTFILLQTCLNVCPRVSLLKLDLFFSLSSLNPCDSDFPLSSPPPPPPPPRPDFHVDLV